VGKLEVMHVLFPYPPAADSALSCKLQPIGIS